jgi:hypothetical protein
VLRVSELAGRPELLPLTDPLTHAEGEAASARGFCAVLELADGGGGGGLGARTPRTASCA